MIPTKTPTATDPVCGMDVDPLDHEHELRNAGKLVQFCSADCKATFAANPAKYANGMPSVPPTASDSGVLYTCPMHPQIRQYGPGSCPICGMALEPLTLTAEAPENPELIDMTRRFSKRLNAPSNRSPLCRDRAQHRRKESNGASVAQVCGPPSQAG